MLNIKSTKNVSSERFVSLIVGPSGIGKTSLVKTLPEPQEATLIISAESGLLCLQGTDFPVIEINPENPSDSLGEVFSYLTTDEAKSKYKYLFIDSLTEIGELILTELKNDEKYQDPKMTLKMYSVYNDTMTKIIKAFRDLRPYSVIFTCLNEFEKNGLEMVETFNIPGQSVKSDIKAWFDLVFSYKIFSSEGGDKHRMLVTDIAEAPLSKDRSGKLDPYEKADLSVIINKVLGV